MTVDVGDLRERGVEHRDVVSGGVLPALPRRRTAASATATCTSWGRPGTVWVRPLEGTSDSLLSGRPFPLVTWLRGGSAPFAPRVASRVTLSLRLSHWSSREMANSAPRADPPTGRQGGEDRPLRRRGRVPHRLSRCRPRIPRGTRIGHCAAHAHDPRHRHLVADHPGELRGIGPRPARGPAPGLGRHRPVHHRRRSGHGRRQAGGRPALRSDAHPRSPCSSSRSACSSAPRT